MPARSVLVCAAALSVIAFGALPAAAEDVVPYVDALAVTAPAMRVRLDHDALTQTVCASGALRSTRPTINPTWRMTTIGTRSNGTAIRDSRVFTGTSFSFCYIVDKQYAEWGNFTTVLSYDGIGDDYPSAIFGDGIWLNGQDNEWEMAQ